MRLGVSFRLPGGVRVGASINPRTGRPRVWASERVGRGVRVSQSTVLGKKRRKR